MQDNTDTEVLTKLWTAFLKFEYNFGTLEAYQALEVCLPSMLPVSFFLSMILKAAWCLLY